MAAEILHFLERRLLDGQFHVGQLLVSPEFSLRHEDDKNAPGLVAFASPYDAVEIARYDDAGKYRPLKTAPNLKRGWILQLGSSQQLLQALDFIYPAAIGTALAMDQGRAAPVNLRTTLARQTGMYAVVKRITDPQAEALVKTTCLEGCLRKILWSISGQCPAPERSEERDSKALPICCVEACNLLVAAGRPIAKGNPAAS